MPKLCATCGESHDWEYRRLLREGGFVDSWLDYTEPFEYPARYALFALLIMAACAVDGRVLINPGSKPETKTNLYTLLYGPSGARKSEALYDALDLLGEGVREAPVLPMNFTMEALRGRLAEDSMQAGRAAGLVLAEELSTLLGGREYLLNNSLFLSKVWDGRPKETFLTIAHQEQIIRNAYITLGGCSTPEAFADLDPKGLSAGFLRRVLFVVSYGPKHTNAQPDVRYGWMQGVLAPRFRAAVGPDAFPADTMMRLDKDAAALNNEWYTREIAALRAKHPGQRESHFVNTLQVHAFKISALLHLLEGQDPEWLSAESLGSGISLCRLLLPGVFEAYAGLVPTPLAKQRAAMMRIAGASSVALRDAELDQALWKEMGISPEQASDVRLSLLQAGMIKRRTDGKLEVGT